MPVEEKVSKRGSPPKHQQAAESLHGNRQGMRVSNPDPGTVDLVK